jgi:hypothetical protein
MKRSEESEKGKGGERMDNNKGVRTKKGVVVAPCSTQAERARLI